MLILETTTIASTIASKDDRKGVKQSRSLPGLSRDGRRRDEKPLLFFLSYCPCPGLPLGPTAETRQKAKEREKTERERESKERERHIHIIVVVVVRTGQILRAGCC